MIDCDRRVGDGRIRVLVADDDEALRRTLVRLIASSPDLHVVGVAGDGDEAIRLGIELQADVALVDVEMPGGGGVRVTEALRSSCPDTRVLVLSGSAGRAEVMEMLAAGASGYVVKGGDVDLVSAVKATSRGQGVLTSEVAADVIGELSERLVEQKHQDQRREDDMDRIRVALGGAFAVVYQPVFALDSLRVVGYEALCRFDLEPRRSPDLWFGEAWALGLGFELETSVVAAAIKQFAGDGSTGELAVNFSPETLTDGRFERWSHTAGGLDGLVIEVTEHAMVEDYDALNRSVAAARAAGARIAIDDAGAGYSSLRHILMLRPDFVKLDGSLVTGIQDDPAKRAVAAGLISSAAELGASVIAEAIETSDELGCVIRLGAAYGQGYHLGRPGPLPKVPE